MSRESLVSPGLSRHTRALRASLGGFIVTALANNIGDLLTRRAALNP
ncbi:MAG: hypothetical protein RLZZ174_1666, partial [Pseudomonadota bacterium]